MADLRGASASISISGLLRSSSRYLVAVLLTGAAVLAVAYLEFLFQRPYPSVFTIAVCLSTWYGGFRPGMLASLLSVLAWDYFFQLPQYSLLVSTPANGVQLALFMVAAIMVSLFVRQRKRAEAAADEATYRSLHDPLTELPNRALVEDRISQALHLARRQQSVVDLLLMDLDGFKEVNDTFGHQLGDELLRQLGTRLKGTLRESDTVGRIGGDEFLVILTPTSASRDVADAVDKVAAALVEPFILEGQSVLLRASIGAARYPRDGLTVADLTRHADLAMYAAKRERKADIPSPSASLSAPAAAMIE